MRQIFTLLALCAFVTKVNAQFTESFENVGSLPSSCWQLTNTSVITASLVVSGAQSIGTDASNNSEIKSPYLNLSSGSSLVSFKYRLNNKLNNSSSRLIEIGTTDKNGNFTLASSLTLDKNTSFNSILSYSATLSMPVGTQRFTIRVSTANGDGNSFLIIDDLSVSAASLNYATGCNASPVAANDNYAQVQPVASSGNVLTNDNTPENNESYTVALVSSQAQNGTLVLNPNGAFSFTPTGGFVGGPVTFTYRINDNGFDALTSNTATVTINYPMQAFPLPIKLVSFSGSLSASSVQLKWIVDDNETGNFFELEKSEDGKEYKTTALVLVSSTTGKASYSYTDKAASTTYYRLKIVNKDGSISYSKVLLFRTSKETNENRLTLQSGTGTSLNFTYNSSTAGTFTATLYSMNGTALLTTKINCTAGINSFSLDAICNFPKGVYIMEVANNAERTTAKLIK
jgi:hypothetical protein